MYILFKAFSDLHINTNDQSWNVMVSCIIWYIITINFNDNGFRNDQEMSMRRYVIIVMDIQREVCLEIPAFQ